MIVVLLFIDISSTRRKASFQPSCQLWTFMCVHQQWTPRCSSGRSFRQ